MKDSKYIFDSWFNDLYEDLAWEQACKEQENHDKAAYLAISFFPQEGDYQFAKNGFLADQNHFVILYFSLKNESRNNINP